MVQALSDLAEKEKVIMLNYGANGDEMTGKLFNRHLFRVAISASQHSTALAAHFESTPFMKYYIFCQDYSAPRQGAEAFKRAMKKYKPGWKLGGEDYHPVGMKDMGPYISKIIESKAEVMFTIDWGGDLIVLMKQAAAMGMKSKVASFYLSDPSVAEVIGDAGIGAITAEILYDDGRYSPEQGIYRAMAKKQNYSGVRVSRPIGREVLPGVHVHGCGHSKGQFHQA